MEARIAVISSRLLCRAGAGLVVATAALLCATAPAQATTTPAAHVVPLTAQGCSGDVCIYLSSPSNGTVYVQAWAYNSSFYGYFHLSGPDGLSSNSSTITWIGGKGNYNQWSGVSAVVGQYCVTGYSYGDDIGRACESIE